MLHHICRSLTKRDLQSHYWYLYMSSLQDGVYHGGYYAYDYFTPPLSRQNKLDEALMSSGRFSDALQSLLEWLGKAEAYLSEEQPILGDLDTVNILIEQHKVSESLFTYLSWIRERSFNMPGWGVVLKIWLATWKQTSNPPPPPPSMEVKKQNFTSPPPWW